MNTPVETLEFFERIRERYRKHLDASPWHGQKEVTISTDDFRWMCEQLTGKLSQAAYDYKQGLLNPEK